MYNFTSLLPSFNTAHVIYQAYLILASTTSCELIEQVLKKADIIDDPYRYYVYERNMDEDGRKIFMIDSATVCYIPIIDNGIVLERSDCPLQLQMEWTNFYGRRFELYCRNTQFVNVQCQVKGLSNDTTQMRITEVTPCSVLTAMATNSFKVPESCGKLKIVCMHIKNKSEPLTEQLLNNNNDNMGVTLHILCTCYNLVILIHAGRACSYL